MAYFDHTIHMLGVLERATNNYFAADAESIRPMLSEARWTALTILVSSVMLLPLTIQFIAVHATTFRLNRRRHLSRIASRKKALSHKPDVETRTGDESASEFESLDTLHHVVQLQDEKPIMNEGRKAPPTLKGGKPNDIMGLGATGVVYDSGCRTLVDDTSMPRLKGGSPERHGDGLDNRREEMTATNIIMTGALWQMYFGRWACFTGTMQLFNERAYHKAFSSGKSVTAAHEPAGHVH